MRKQILTMMAWMMAAACCAGAVDVLRRADDFYTAQKWPEALAAYKEALPAQRGAERAETLSRIGYAYQRGAGPNATRYEDALEAYRQAMEVEECPDVLRAGVLVRSGYCLQMLRRYEEGERTYGAVLDVEGASVRQRADGQLGVARCLYAQGKTNETLRAFEKLKGVAAEDPPYLATARLGRGSLLYKLHRWTEALEEFRQVVAMESPGWKNKQDAESFAAEIELRQNADRGFWLDPYVTRVSATSAVITWASLADAPIGEARLHEGEREIRRLAAERTPVPETSDIRQSVRFADLKPDTAYAYTVDCAGTSREGRFRTAPTAARPFTFCVYGDSQDRPAMHRRVADRLAEVDPEFVLHVGDMIGKGTHWGQWKIGYFDPARAYLGQAPIWPAMGNHDGGPFFARLFHMEEQRYYHFHYGNTLVVVLDSNWPGSVGSATRQKQLAWLEDVLSRDTSLWKIVAYHHPTFYTTLLMGRGFGLEDFLPILEKHEVDLVFTGHDHVYRRSLPIGPVGKKPVIHITVGGGGGFTRWDPEGNASPVLAHGHAFGLSHFCTLRIDGNRLNLVATDVDGNAFDQLELVKQAGAYPPEIMNQAVETSLANLLFPAYDEMNHPDRRHSFVPATFSPAPEAGRKVNLLIPTPIAPAGAELVVRAAEGCTWRVAPAALKIVDRQVQFEAVAPTDLKISGTRLDPPLRVEINYRVDGRSFEPAVVQVVPNQ